MTPPEAHLPPPPFAVTRALRERGWAHSLSEPDMPRRLAGAPDAATALTRIGDWLDVENVAQHRRWAPAANTYCNIYAHDYCALAGAYLPRVWWLPTAIAAWRAGQPIAARYGKTVGEANANALFDWLAAWGAPFGWRALDSAAAAQGAANAGRVVVWAGAKKAARLSGHITVVVPETGLHRAPRDAATQAVTIPLQSQAGRNNRRYHMKHLFGGPSWRGHGFWVHD